jgi:hypothetical protein
LQVGRVVTAVHVAPADHDQHVLAGRVAHGGGGAPGLQPVGRCAVDAGGSEPQQHHQLLAVTHQ